MKSSAWAPCAIVLSVIGVVSCHHAQPAAAPPAAATPAPALVPIIAPYRPQFVDVPCPDFTLPAQMRRHVAAPNGELRGQIGVDDARSKSWDGHAVVELDGRKPPPYIVSNLSGRFVVSGVQDGEHALRIRAIGYFTLIDTVIVDQRGVAMLEYKLEPSPSEWMGMTCRDAVPTRKPD